MVSKIHPYTKWKNDRRRFDRKPSASQNAVRFWWTRQGTKVVIQQLKRVVARHVIHVVDPVKPQPAPVDIETTLIDLIAIHRSNTLKASANRTAAAAKEWGMYERMLELYRVGEYA